MHRNLVRYCMWAAAILCAIVAFGQGNQPATTMPPGNAYEFVNVVFTVSDLDRAVAFYHDIYGFEIKSQEKTPVSDKALMQLTGVQGAKIRRAVLALPDFGAGLELVEFTGVKRTPIVLRKQDPASTNLNFRVKDANALWAAAKQRGGTAITAGGDPLDQKNANGTTTRFFFLHDPDGFVDEYTQAIPEPAASASAPNNVMSASIAVQSSNSERTAEFYKVLGIDLRLGQPQPWTEIREKLTGTGHVTLRSSNALIPTAKNRWSVFEYPGGNEFHSNLQDPGVSMFSVKVHDAAAAAKAVKAAGGSVASTGGDAVKMPKGGMGVIIRDPDGFFMEMIQE